MNNWLGTLIAVAVAAGLTAYCAWLWRWKADSGNHRLARGYHHYYRLQGWPARNGFAVIPVWAAVAWLVAIGLLLATVFGEAVPSWPFLIIGLALFVLMVVALVRPPGWLFPPWLREARVREKARLPSNVPVPPEGRRPVMTRRAYWLSIAGLIAFVAVWLYLGLPAGNLLIGLAVGLPVLAATRIKR